MRKKYLFFDIDGTLAISGYGQTRIPDSTKYALRKLKEAGHFIAISTGRAQFMAVSIMKELGFHNMVSDGGMGITINDELLGITPLNRDLVIALVKECIQKDFIWGLQTDNSNTRKVPDNRFMDYTHDTYLESEIVDGLDPADYPEIYKMYVACAPGDEEQLETLKLPPWCRFHKQYIFVEPTDNAFGIRKVLAHFGGDPADVVVFGDAKNDLSMFIDDWTCVAMGNGCDEIKARADFITRDVDDDGILYACEELGLFEKADQ